jgi:dinuclear metal center YbgI/SA1388 family protein
MMSLHLNNIIKNLEQLAPVNLKEEWDNVGLQINSHNNEITSILIALDITLEVVDEAIKKQCNLIISHHPLVFKPLHNINIDTPKGKIIQALFKNDISIYCMHTNLDNSSEGINQYLCKILNLHSLHPLLSNKKELLYKLVTYVPDQYLEQVKTELYKANLGIIGNYSHYSFEIKGTSSFKPLDDANPFLGEINKQNIQSETKLEILVKENEINKAVELLLSVHPYENVAYDLIQLHNTINLNGTGVIAEFDKEIKTDDFMDLIKKKLKLDIIRWGGKKKEKIKTIGICSGSGGSYLSAAINNNLDVYLTGDIKYHEAQLAYESNILLIDIEHYNSEIVVLDLLSEYLLSVIIPKNNCKIYKTTRNNNFIKYDICQ